MHQGEVLQEGEKKKTIISKCLAECLHMTTDSNLDKVLTSLILELPTCLVNVLVACKDELRKKLLMSGVLDVSMLPLTCTCRNKHRSMFW